MPTQNEPPIHPAALLMPLMTAEEYAQLRADIREHGLLEPIVMFDGQILDGRHRWRACMDEGIPPHTEEWDGKGTPIEFVISKNLHRRHLTPGQRGMIGVPIAEYIAATEGKAAQQRAAAVTNAVLGRSSRETLVHNCEQASPPTSLLTDIDSTTAAPDVLAPSPRSPRTRKSIAKAGALVGVSHNTIARAAAVAKADPELADRVKAGTMT